jgi:hypothetical protein
VGSPEKINRIKITKKKIERKRNVVEHCIAI